MTNFSGLEVDASLREKVGHQLRSALIAGELKPGEVYSVPSLATILRVSATPVREAMLDLVREGAVSPVRNKGFRITKMSDADLDSVLAVRQLLEVPAIREVARKIDKETVDRLRPVAKEIEDAARARDLVGFIKLDTEFHLELLAVAGNDRLVSIVRDLRMLSRLTGLEPLVEKGRLVDTAREHTQLLDLVAARDSEAAAELTRRHLGHVRGAWAGIPESPEEATDPE